MIFVEVVLQEKLVRDELVYQQDLLEQQLTQASVVNGLRRNEADLKGRSGQLESEILRNDWLTAEGDADLVFAADDAAKWAKALGRLGVDPLTLSAAAGHA